MSKKHKKNKKIFHFKVICPYNNCRKGILFNKKLINEVIYCPSCKERVKLCLPEQLSGMDHVKQLRNEAEEIWKKIPDEDATDDKWISILKYVMASHRNRLSDKKEHRVYTTD